MRSSAPPRSCWTRAQANDKIKWLLNSEVTDVLGDGAVSGVKLQDTRHR